MTAGFFDEQHVATGGVLGIMAYSADGAQTWLQTDAQADCRYGIEVVSPTVIFTCGGATNVRRSVDGGRTWQALAPFGNFRTITSICSIKKAFYFSAATMATAGARRVTCLLPHLSCRSRSIKWLPCVSPIRNME